MNPELPRIGATVTVTDPMGYSGTGIVIQVQERPHHAVLVELLTITDRTSQTAVGRQTWVLGPHVQENR